MDAPKTSQHQEKEGDQQPSELPILGEKDNSLETSGHVPLDADTRKTLATEPFQPILKVLADFSRDDPKFAFPAARLVRLYRRLWESCVSKHGDGQKLQQSNQILKEASTQLSKESDRLQLRHDKAAIQAALFQTGIGIIPGVAD